jgi:hypothetical protein
MKINKPTLFDGENPIPKNCATKIQHKTFSAYKKSITHSKIFLDPQKERISQPRLYPTADYSGRER